MTAGEASRLYQAALEERRLVRSRVVGLIASEAVDALRHIEAEVTGTMRVLEVAWLRHGLGGESGL